MTLVASTLGLPAAGCRLPAGAAPGAWRPACADLTTESGYVPVAMGRVWTAVGLIAVARVAAPFAVVFLDLPVVAGADRSSG